MTLVEKAATALGIYYYSQRLLKVKKGDVILPVPAYRQVHSYTCAYVAGLMVLHYAHIYNKDSLFLKVLDTDEEEGVPMTRMLRALRKCGLRVGIRHNVSFEQIAYELLACRPIITTVEQDEHWVAVVGCNINKRIIYTNGDDVRHYKWKEFKKEWGNDEVIFTRGN